MWGPSEVGLSPMTHFELIHNQFEQHKLEKYILLFSALTVSVAL